MFSKYGRLRIKYANNIICKAIVIIIILIEKCSYYLMSKIARYENDLLPTFNSLIRSKLYEDEIKCDKFINIIRENKPKKPKE